MLELLWNYWISHFSACIYIQIRQKSTAVEVISNLAASRMVSACFSWCYDVWQINTFGCPGFSHYYCHKNQRLKHVLPYEKCFGTGLENCRYIICPVNQTHSKTYVSPPLSNHFQSKRSSQIPGMVVELFFHQDQLPKLQREEKHGGQVNFMPYLPRKRYDVWKKSLVAPLVARKSFGSS